MANMLDTDIAIYACDGMEAVLEKLEDYSGSVLISALTLAELQRGVYRTKEHTALRLARMGVLLRNIPVLPFDAVSAERYGQIVAQCGWVRSRDFDRMIAAHAIASRSVLVTNNVADFRDIAGLAMENWVRSA